jgi:hypothetical protein
VLLRRIALELRYRSDSEVLPPLSDFGFVAVVNRGDVKSALGESAIARERSADLARADDADLPLFTETEDLAELFGKFGNGIAEATLSEGSEQ